MTVEEAITILDPETRRETLRKIPVMDRIEADQEACRIAVAALRAQLESNDPLTLEQLRKMDGEPVCIAPVDGGPYTWMLVDTEYEVCREAYGGLAVFENLGKTWLAYRRRPEVV